jgi:hypothetical protein
LRSRLPFWKTSAGTRVGVGREQGVAVGGRGVALRAAAAVGAANSLGVALGAGGVTVPAGAELSQPPNIATVRSAGHSLRINMPSMMLTERRQSSALSGHNS